MDVVQGSLQRTFITQVLIAKHAKEDNFVAVSVLVHFAIEISL